MTRPITSLHNPRIKAAARLRETRGRKQQTRILIDGLREIQRAFQANVQLVELFVDHQAPQDQPCRDLIQQLKTARIPVLPVSSAVFAKIAYGQRDEAIVAVARRPVCTLNDLPLQPTPLIAVLEAVEKPGNLGAVVRSADAAGLSGLIVADAVTDLFHPNAIRASLGTVFTLPVCQATSQETLRWLRQANIRIYATRVDAALSYTQVSFQPASAIVLGNETRGLTPQWQAADVTSIKVPMRGMADSLNVSATAAVLFYEALRQRQQEKPN